MSFENLYDEQQQSYRGSLAEWIGKVKNRQITLSPVHSAAYATPAKPPRIIRSFEDLYDEYGIPGDPTAFHTVYFKGGRKLLGVLIKNHSNGEPMLFPCYRVPDAYNKAVASGGIELIAVVYAKCN